MEKNISRRRFNLVSATAAVAGGLACLSSAKSHAATQDPGNKMNVLVIHTDQHRLDCLGVNGNTELRTPHIDAIAAEGTRYTNSFCSYPVSTPSRYSFLSGQYVHEHEGWSNHCTLKPGTPTFASVLRDAGYKTKAIGKMHFTPTYLDVGFDEMELSEQNGPGRWDDDYHRELKQHGLVDRNDLEDQNREYRDVARTEYWDSFGALPTNLPDGFHTTDWIGNRAVKTLESWGESGNLLMTGFVKPHHPFDPPKEWAEKYDAEALTLLPGWTDECLERDLKQSRGYFPNEKLTKPAIRRAMAYYYATIEHIDAQVGRMVETLKRKGLYEKTLIVFTADHGEYMGFHHMLLKGNHLYDPLMKVPLVIRNPQALTKGAVCDGLVSNVDVAPTILAAAGLAVPETMSGKALDQAGADREIVLADGRNGTEVMVRSKTRKLIVRRGKRKDKSFFFDLEKDPHELTDRYEDAAYQDEIQAFEKAAEAFHPSGGRNRPYLDEKAPRIKAANVPPLDDGHREEMIVYFKKKMGSSKERAQ